ncbi:MAG: DUF47 domain-containing protein [Christensenellaceae bacterium]|jgi:predicted phosphate transport protein (TIGR00153 family)
MARNRGFNYFDAFVAMSDYAHKAALYLDMVFKDFEGANLLIKLEEIHQIEHDADDLRHDTITNLVREFITPIEREDIMEMIQKLDTVVDNIDDVLRYMYMYNVETLRPEASRFSDIIVRCTRSMKSAMENFENFRKSKEIHNYIVEVNMLEEEGDRAQIAAIHDLFTESEDAKELMVWSKIIDCLEACLDGCEEVADALERIVMKNS